MVNLAYIAGRFPHKNKLSKTKLQQGSALNWLLKVQLHSMTHLIRNNDRGNLLTYLWNLHSKEGNPPDAVYSSVYKFKPQDFKQLTLPLFEALDDLFRWAEEHPGWLQDEYRVFLRRFTEPTWNSSINEEPVFHIPLYRVHRLLVRGHPFQKPLLILLNALKENNRH